MYIKQWVSSLLAPGPTFKIINYPGPTRSDVVAGSAVLVTPKPVTFLRRQQ